MCSLVQEEGLEKGSTRKQASKWFLPESEVVLPGLYSKSVSGVENRDSCQVGDDEDLETTRCCLYSDIICHSENAEIIGSAVGKTVYKTCIYSVSVGRFYFP